MKSKKKIIAELENENKRLKDTLVASCDTEIECVPSMYNGCNANIKYVYDGYEPEE